MSFDAYFEVNLGDLPTKETLGGSSSSDSVSLQGKLSCIAALPVTEPNQRDIVLMGTSNGYIFEYDFTDALKQNKLHERSLRVDFQRASQNAALLDSSAPSAALKKSTSRSSDDIKCLAHYHVSNSSVEQIMPLSRPSSSSTTNNASNLCLVLTDGYLQCVELLHNSQSTSDKSASSKRTHQREPSVDSASSQSVSLDARVKVHAKCIASRGCSKFCTNLALSASPPLMSSAPHTSAASHYHPTSHHSIQILCLIKKRLVFFKLNLLQMNFEYYKTLNLTQPDPTKIIWHDDIINLFYGQKDVKISFQTGDTVDQLKDLNIAQITQPLNVNNKRSMQSDTPLPNSDEHTLDQYLRLSPVFGIRDAENKSVQWSDPHPRSLFLAFPHLVALCANHVEFYDLFHNHITTFSKAQSNQIKFARAQYISSSGVFLYVSSANEVLIVPLPPLSSAVKSLLEENRVDDAHHLFQYLLSLVSSHMSQQHDFEYDGSEEMFTSADHILQFNTLAAIILFKNLKFKAAMTYFEKSEMDPRHIISYFPELMNPLSGSTYTAPPDPYLPDLITITQIIEHYISSEQQDDESAHDGDSNVSSAQQDNYFKMAKKQLLKYLETVRDPPFSTVPINNDESSPTSKQEDAHLKIQRDIDFAICKLYINSNNVQQLKDFLLEPNHCHIEDIEHIVNSHEASNQSSAQARKYLAFIYWNKQQEDKALELLKTLNEEAISDTASTADLQSCTNDMIQLLLQCTKEELLWKYLPHVLDNSHKEAMRIFTDDVCPVKFRHDEVLEFLQVYPNEVQRLYMEHLILHDIVSDAKIHTKLALNYVQSILKLKPYVSLKQLPFGARVKAGEEAGFLGELRKSLLNFLKHPRANYNVKRILRVLKGTQLHEEMIEIYKRLHDHASVLRLLVYSIKDLEWAETYCLQMYDELLAEASRASDGSDEEHSTGSVKSWMRVHSSNHEPSGSRTGEAEEDISGASPYTNLTIYNPLWLILLRVCFEEPPTNHGFGLKILKKYSRSIDPLESLSLLPEHLTLGDLDSYLVETIKGSTHNERELGIMESLYHHQFLRSESVLARGLSRRVTVDENTPCGVCGKKLLKSVIAVFPDLSIAHYKCAGRSLMTSRHPVTKVNYRVLPERIELQMDEKTVLGESGERSNV